MSIQFRNVSCPPLQGFSADAPSGSIIGIVGEDGSGKTALAHLAAGTQQPASGEVETAGARRLIGPDDALDFAGAGNLALLHTLARHDALQRERALEELERLRGAGATILLVSHEPDLLRAAADEVWWIHQGRLARRGDPAAVLQEYRAHIAARVREWGASAVSPVSPRWRRGDGRASIERIETLGEDGGSTMVWRSGEKATVRVTVRFHDAVEDPVIGMLIRTRVGLNVYGTNTELEKVKLGPCAAGDAVRVSFRFRCDLCPQHYALTIASHDPDGQWHEWLEDAVAFSVTDSRYTAGVANLRAQVTGERLPRAE
jgi:hypothetical protein